jgi:predicted aldo/keto reductase-like oxidoreductase
MEFRRLGKTNVNVGVIGLGTEYIWHDPLEKVEEVVFEAIDGGVNYIDIFMGSPDVRDNLGIVLKKSRKELLIAGHLGCIDIEGQYAKTRDIKISRKFINDFYKRLQTDYIDILFLHNINEEDEFEEAFGNGGILDLALRLKKEGRVRFIGFSSHKVPVSFKALRSGYLEVFMFPVNPAFDILPGTTGHNEILDNHNKELIVAARDIKERTLLYQECMQRDIGFVAMKPYGAGRIFSLLKDTSERTKVVLQCLNYALTRPGVSTVIPGCKNASEVRSALRYLKSTDTERDHSFLIENLDLNLKGKCMYCNHCQPCPEDLDIVTITQLADAAEKGLTDLLNKKYLMLNTKASACKKCKTCEKRCPFDVSVITNMEKALKIFKI